jgi:serine/threonine-protein kinase SRPK3
MMAANVFLEQGDPSATLQLERLRSYGEGGLCPIYLHDELGVDGRYIVVHKLGSAESSTNWLCRDTKDNSYVGVKVHAASSESNTGLKALAASLSKAPEEGMEHLALPLDSFTMSSVNGTHQCEVLPLMGPPVFRLLSTTFTDPEDILLKVSEQVVSGLGAIHSSGYCHGDLRPDGIAFKVTGLDELDEEQLMQLLGKPRKLRAITLDGIVPESHPEYLVIPADLSALKQEHLLPSICITNFDKVFHTQSPPDGLDSDIRYVPPEYIFKSMTEEEPGMRNPMGTASDLWALGITLFEIRKQDAWSTCESMDSLLEEIISRLGPLPEHMQSIWQEWIENIEEEEKPVEDHKYDPHVLSALLAAGGKPSDPNGGALVVPDGERVVLEDLLRRILAYEPENRIALPDILQHKWFKMSKAERKPTPPPTKVQVQSGPSRGEGPSAVAITAGQSVIHAAPVPLDATNAGALAPNDMAGLAALMGGLCNSRSCCPTM